MILHSKSDPISFKKQEQQPKSIKIHLNSTNNHSTSTNNHPTTTEKHQQLIKQGTRKRNHLRSSVVLSACHCVPVPCVRVQSSHGKNRA